LAFDHAPASVPVPDVNVEISERGAGARGTAAAAATDATNAATTTTTTTPVIARSLADLFAYVQLSRPAGGTVNCDAGLLLLLRGFPDYVTSGVDIAAR